MKTRLISLIAALSLLIASVAFAQEIKWKIIPSPQWGFSIQLPPDASRQRLMGRPASGTCEVYASGGFACIVQVTPTASDALASTAIEQAIQSEIKEATTMGPTARWEATSKEGDLFKGYTGQVRLAKTDPAQSAVIKAIGTERGVQSVALAPLGDETAPVLRIAIVGKPDKEPEVAAMAKTVSSMVAKESKPAVIAPDEKPGQPSLPTPKLSAKPWPQLRTGDIELEGRITSVSSDGKTVMMMVDTIILPGQGPIALSPKRTKKVLLRDKMGALIKGAQIRLVGRNEGVGKPITADAIELAPNPPPEPKIGPPGRTPIS